jgi:glyoxylase-like metal-dependent hydrolase (beta-lactamase superfamily II)
MMIRGFSGGVFQQNGYVVACARTGVCILVDPGAATAQLLADARAATLRVEAIVLTHAHLDHIEGVALAKAETGAPILLHPQDQLLYDAAPQIADSFGIALAPLPPVDGALVNGATLRFGDCRLNVRHAPGHSPGSVLLVAAQSALVGDVIFRGGIGRTDLPGGHLPTLLQSIQEEVFRLPDEVVLHSGHGAETTVGRERAPCPFPDFDQLTTSAN